MSDKINIQQYFEQLLGRIKVELAKEFESANVRIKEPNSKFQQRLDNLIEHLPVQYHNDLKDAIRSCIHRYEIETSNRNKNCMANIASSVEKIIQDKLSSSMSLDDVTKTSQQISEQAQTIARTKETTYEVSTWPIRESSQENGYSIEYKKQLSQYASKIHEIYSKHARSIYSEENAERNIRELQSDIDRLINELETFLSNEEKAQCGLVKRIEAICNEHIKTIQAQAIKKSNKRKISSEHDDFGEMG